MVDKPDVDLKKNDPDNNPWIDWAEKIRAIAQNGLTFSRGEFDLERYHQLQAIAHDMTALLTGAPTAKVNDYFLPDHGYATPKIDLRGGVFLDNKILLVKERSDGRWALPGGWGDVCEPPAYGVEREIVEESGYTARALKLVAVRDTQRHPYRPRSPYHIYKLIFLCELTGGAPKENIEISDIGFFDIDDLPELSGGRTLPEDIQLLLEHKNKRELPTVFD
ncbi:NUDIX hydrolase [Endozoicomonas sp. GU-1]|uniref:NUDIX hydrolase n=1 Tax=Endozoicomonas sp. GU-1 TaxID=3009078 RepID=UPI0022B396A8|nr:NUDIX hydrolase [Endozoicomonas sp. GU-1]WBA83182.1 NUDIX hydrolase [Endozoicomonas sp. GU-1]WBA86109.1 NUDIX hydrolase [Endozoicomonas sp. GU-1]